MRVVIGARAELPEEICLPEDTVREYFGLCGKSFGDGFVTVNADRRVVLFADDAFRIPILRKRLC